MATLALFLVLAGGGAYAASKLKNNSVSTAKIRNGAVTKPKLGADVSSAFLPASAAAGFLPASAASGFLPANAASNFQPSGSVKRISFRPTGCGFAPATGPCTAGFEFSGAIVQVDCFQASGPGNPPGPSIAFSIAGATGGLSANLTYTSANGTAVRSRTGGGSWFSFVNDNVVGTMVMNLGSGQMVTIPFHAFAGAGTSPTTSNCVFEGTAATA